MHGVNPVIPVIGYMQFKLLATTVPVQPISIILDVLFKMNVWQDNAQLHHAGSLLAWQILWLRFWQKTDPDFLQVVISQFLLFLAVFRRFFADIGYRPTNALFVKYIKIIFINP